MDVDDGAIPGPPNFNDRVLAAITKARRNNPSVFKFPSGLNQGLDPGTLLQLIVETHHANPRPTMAYITHVSQYPALAGVLNDAYKNQSFQDILHNDVSSFFTTSVAQTDITPGGLPKSDSARSLTSTFETEYVGETAKLFVQTMSYYYAGKPVQRLDVYNWALSIVQSSGMGKSRMIEEVAKMMFSIPMNLRDDLPEGLQAFPPPDISIRDYFDSHQNKSDLRLQGEYAILLRVLFDHAVEKLDDPSFKTRAGRKLASSWASFLTSDRTDTQVSNNRRIFFDEVVSKAVLEHHRITENEVCVNKLFREMTTSCSAFVKRVTENQRPRGVVGDPDVDMDSPIGGGHNGGLGGVDFVPLALISFDEAHGLASPLEFSIPTRQRTPYHNLGTVLAELKGCPVFFAFLSTASRVGQFAPPAAIHPSARVVKGRYVLPPFTELPFNIFMSTTLGDNTATLSHLSKTDVIVGFGRPLWYMYHHQQKDGELLRFAGNKLICLGVKPSAEEMRKARIAALGVRIGISFDTTMQSSRSLESDLVHSHMRIVYAIPEHREFFHGGSPSEPVLAEAAARFLNEGTQAGIEILGPTTLAEACELGFLARGERGELCRRLLTTIAHDKAVHKFYAGKKFDESEPFYHRAVPVTEFLQALFAPNFHEMILNASPVYVPSHSNPQTLADRFRNSFVFFTQWCLAEDSKMLEPHNLAVALVKGMAIQAKENQESIDGVIPIHLGSLDTPISSQKTSAINLQDKNRKCTKNCSIERTITVPDLNTPVISIIFEFDDNKAASGSRDLGSLVTIPTRTESNGLRPRPLSSHYDTNHYEISVYGHSSQVFAAIPKAMEEKYGSILASRSIKDDFPRRGNMDNLEAFHNLQPFHNGQSEQQSGKWGRWIRSYPNPKIKHAGRNRGT